MEIKRGIAVSPGVVIGPALVLDTELFRLPERFIEGDRVGDEVQRLRQAMAQAAEAAREKQQAITAKLGPQYGAILGAHALLIEDESLVTEIENLVRNQGYTAEYAVSRVMRRHAKALESLNRAQFSSRATDLFDIEKSILRHLLGHRPGPGITSVEDRRRHGLHHSEAQRILVDSEMADADRRARRQAGLSRTRNLRSQRLGPRRHERQRHICPGLRRHWP